MKRALRITAWLGLVLGVLVYLNNTDLLKAKFAGATWIDGKTICAEDSVGQCHPVRPGHSISEAEPSG